MQAWLIFLIEQYGYMSLFWLMIIENVFPPIPSELVLTFGGFMTSLTYLTIPGVIIVSSLGSFIGALILFWVGKLLNPRRLERWLDSPWAIRLHFKKEQIEKTELWFEKHGKKAVFFGRLVPMIRSLISIPAGMSQMSFLPFSLYTLLGTILWDTILVSIGVALGTQWNIISVFMQQYKVVIWSGVGIVVSIYLIKKKFT